MNNPTNALTGKEYQGSNIVTLLVAMEEGGYTDPRFLTFRQAIQMGRCVRKGEKAAARITKFVQFDEQDDDNGKTKKRTAPRTYCVFNIEQTEALEEKKAA